MLPQLRRVARFDAGPPTRQVVRYDRGTLLRPVRTAEGFMLAEARAARVGVMEYLQADGSIIREYVPPETLRDAASLASLARKPVTLQHPDQDRYPTGMVDTANARELTVGDLDGEVAYDEDELGGFVRVRICVRTKDALDAIDAGIQEVSPGYLCDVEMTPGDHPKYGKYDAIQRSRRYNHLAIVDEARGGKTVRLRADAAMQVRRDAAPGGTTPAPGGTPRGTMKNLKAARALLRQGKRADARKLLIDSGATAEQADEFVELEMEADPAMADKDKQIADLKAQIAALEGARDAAQAAADKAAADMAGLEKKAMDAAEAKLKERLPLLDRAAKVGIPTADADKLDAAGLRKAIALKLVPVGLKADAADAYYAAVLDLRADASGSDRKDAASPWDVLRADAAPGHRADADTTDTRTPDERRRDALKGKE